MGCYEGFGCCGMAASPKPASRRVNEHSTASMGGRRRDRARSNGKHSYLSACRVRRCARLATKQAHRVIAHVVAQALAAVGNAGAWLRH